MADPSSITTRGDSSTAWLIHLALPQGGSGVLVNPPQCEAKISAATTKTLFAATTTVLSRRKPRQTWTKQDLQPAQRPERLLADPTLSSVQTPHHPLCQKCRLLTTHFVQSADSSPPTLSRVQTPHHPCCPECRLLTTHVVQSADSSPPTLSRVQIPHHPCCPECRLLTTHFVQSADCPPPTLSRAVQTPHHPLCPECRHLTTHFVQSADSSSLSPSPLDASVLIGSPSASSMPAKSFSGQCHRPWWTSTDWPETWIKSSSLQLTKRRTIGASGQCSGV